MSDSSSNKTPANLRPPWKPGQSGNPKGRPKGRRLTDILREALDSQEIGGVPIEGGERVADVFVRAVLGHAVQSGNASIIKEIFDRIDGRVPKAAPAQPDDAPAKPRIEIPDSDPRFVDEGGCPAEEVDPVRPDAEGTPSLRPGGDG